MALVTKQLSMNGSSGPWLKRVFTGLAVMAVLALVVWGVSQIKLGSASTHKRQTVKITLPDMPPPPPLKQEEKRPPPKEENKPTPQMEQKQVEAPPQPAQSLKMEGAAGDGPSAFSAGSVSKDYTNGPVSGTAATGGTSSDRAKYQFYVNSTKQLLKDEIERNLQTEQRQVVVSFSLWVKADGGVDHYELSSTGNERADDDLKAAFALMAKSAKLPPPRDTPQPLRLRMTLLPIAS